MRKVRQKSFLVDRNPPASRTAFVAVDGKVYLSGEILSDRYGEERYFVDDVGKEVGCLRFKGDCLVSSQPSKESYLFLLVNYSDDEGWKLDPDAVLLDMQQKKVWRIEDSHVLFDEELQKVSFTFHLYDEDIKTELLVSPFLLETELLFTRKFLTALYAAFLLTRGRPSTDFSVQLANNLFFGIRETTALLWRRHRSGVLELIKEATVFNADKLASFLSNFVPVKATKFGWVFGAGHLTYIPSHETLSKAVRLPYPINRNLMTSADVPFSERKALHTVLRYADKLKDVSIRVEDFGKRASCEHFLALKEAYFPDREEAMLSEIEWVLSQKEEWQLHEWIVREAAATAWLRELYGE